MSGARRCLAIARGALLLGLLAPVPASAAAGSASPVCLPPASAPAPAPAAATPLAAAPEQVLACIGPQPISAAAFRHWAAIAARAEGPPTKGHPAPSVTAAKQEVMDFLISSNWVLGEARDLGLHVSEAEVRRRFDHVRNQQFRTRREFHAFLRASGETLADLVFRVRLNLASERIEMHVAAGHRGARSQASALAKFLVTFKRKWQAQTSCASQYAVADCGRVY
jgi:hypothetical protein